MLGAIVYLNLTSSFYASYVVCWKAYKRATVQPTQLGSQRVSTKDRIEVTNEIPVHRLRSLFPLIS